MAVSYERGTPAVEEVGMLVAPAHVQVTLGSPKASMAHTRQSSPDSGLGFKANVLPMSSLF